MAKSAKNAAQPDPMATKINKRIKPIRIPILAVMNTLLLLNTPDSHISLKTILLTYQFQIAIIQVHEKEKINT